MQRRTAWLIAQAYADLVGITADTAFHLLIEESGAEKLPGPSMTARRS